MATVPAVPSEAGDLQLEAKASHQHVAELELKAKSSEGQITSAFATMSRPASIRTFWRLFAGGLGVAVGGMYIGYVQSVVGSIVANQGFINQFATVTDPETGERVLDAKHVALWSAIVFASQVVSQILSPFSADRWGRKMNMYILTFFLTLSIVLAIVAKDWKVLTASRICGGLAGGFIGTSVMVYLSEVSMPQFRGTLLGSFSLFFALGQLALAVGMKILNDTNPMAFRNMFYSEFVFLALWIGPLIYIPESPAWLASKGRHDEAKKALLRLVGNVSGYDVDHEYLVIRSEVENSMALAKEHSENGWKVMLTKLNMKRTIIATLPFTYQNFVGVPLIFGFTTYFFSLANVEDPFLGSLIIQLILLAGIISAFYWVDKVGRRILVIGGGAIMGTVTFLIGGLAFLKPSTASGIGLITLCSFWTFTYANSLAPIGWISLVEVSTPHLRAKTAAIAAVIQSCSGVLFSYTIPLLLSDQGAGWGQKIGLFFGGISFLYLIPVIFLFPETKGRTYQELDEMFEAGVPAWRFASTKTRYQATAEIHNA